MQEVDVIKCISDTKEDINRQLQGKVSYKIFFWFSGILATILSATIGYVASMNSNYTRITIENASTLSTIKEKVSNLEKQQESILDIFAKNDIQFIR